MPTDKTISRGLFPRGAPIFFGLCTSPPLYQSIKKRIRSIPITLLKFWVGTRFVTPIGKNMSPEGYSHAERKIFVSLCTSSHSYQSIKKKSKSIPTTVLKFWVGTRFVTTPTTPTPTTPTPTTPTNDAAEDHNTLSGQSPSQAKNILIIVIYSNITKIL